MIKYKNPSVAVTRKIKETLDEILGEGNWKFWNETMKCDYSEKLAVGAYQLKVSEPNVIAATFKLYPMINCCGICVSTEAEVRPDFQHKGLGRALNSLRIDIARALGYGLLLCTDDVANEYQRKILKQNGWKDVHEFINPRTGHRVAVSVINL